MDTFSANGDYDPEVTPGTNLLERSRQFDWNTDADALIADEQLGVRVGHQRIEAVHQMRPLRFIG